MATEIRLINIKSIDFFPSGYSIGGKWVKFSKSILIMTRAREPRATTTTTTTTTKSTHPVNRVEIGSSIDTDPARSHACVCVRVVCGLFLLWSTMSTFAQVVDEYLMNEKFCVGMRDSRLFYGKAMKWSKKKNLTKYNNNNNWSGWMLPHGTREEKNKCTRSRIGFGSI